MNGIGLHFISNTGTASSLPRLRSIGPCSVAALTERKVISMRRRRFRTRRIVRRRRVSRPRRSGARRIRIGYRF